MGDTRGNDEQTLGRSGALSDMSLAELVIGRVLRVGIKGNSVFCSLLLAREP